MSAATQPTVRIPPAALLQLGLAVALLGASWPVTKVALLDGAGPSWFALGRAGLSAVVGAAAVAASRGLRLPGRADLPALLSIGLLQLAGFFAFAHAAVAWVPAGRTAILSNATLIWTVPIAVLLTHEAIPARRWIATMLGAAGVVVLAGPWAIDWSSGPVLLGHAFLLGSSLCWAISMAVVRRYPPRQPFFALLPWAFAIATVALLPMALLHEPGRWSGPSLTCLGCIGLVMAPLGTWCLVQATLALPLIVASVGFLAGPAIGLLVSAVWLGEPLTASVLAGAGLILGGAALAAGSAGR
jgi:drug/metabolite transporter (DMT)-like permease